MFSIIEKKTFSRLINLVLFSFLFFRPNCSWAAASLTEFYAKPQATEEDALLRSHLAARNFAAPQLTFR